MEYRGLVVASKVKSRNIFSDIGSCFVGCCGGEIKDLSKLTNDIRQTRVLGTCCNSVTPTRVSPVPKSDIREELLMELREKAASLGANAIVGLT